MRASRPLSVCLACIAALVLGPRPAARGADEPFAEQDAIPTDASDAPATDLEEPAEPFEPRQPRSPQAQDRVQALALFAAARTAEDRGDYAVALRQYQRAWRLDPASAAVVERILPLALGLDRPDVAARYARLEVPLSEASAGVLRRLGLHLSEAEDYAGAAALFERAYGLAGDESRGTAPGVLLRLETGRLHFLADDYQAAAACFTEVAAALEDPARHGLDGELVADVLAHPERLHNLFAEAFLRADRTDEAETQFRKALDAGGEERTLAWGLARVWQARGEHQQAIDQVEALLKLPSDQTADADVYELLATELDALGRGAEVLPRLQTQAGERPDDAALGWVLARRLSEAGQTDAAAQAADALLETAPTADGFRLAARLRRELNHPVELLAVLGRLAAATGNLDRLETERDAILADAALVDAVLAAAAGQAAGDAAARDAGQLFAAALLAGEAERYDRAAELFPVAYEASEEDARPQVLLAWGLMHLAADRPAESTAVFRRGIDEKLLPDDNPALPYYLATSLEMAGQTDESLDVILRAIALADDAPLLRSRHAWILYHAGRRGEARAAYAALVERLAATAADTDTADTLREARLSLSHLCVLDGDLPAAEEWLEQVLDDDPLDVGAGNDLGYLWADAGHNLHRALPLAERAVAAEPENAAYLDTLGWVLFRLGRPAEAATHLERAIQHDDEPDGVVLDHLGDVYLAAGRAPDALDAWRRALEHYDPVQDAARIEPTRQKIEQHQQQ
jgi:tetratricopeptide (TPR) repeat protein